MSSLQKNIIHIAIIEDDDTIRTGYEYLLNAVPDYNVTGVYNSYEKACLDIEEKTPDILLLDIQLPGINGIEAILKLKKIQGLKIIMLTAYEDPELIFQALSNGASGYLNKNIPASKLIESIKDIIEGGGTLSANVARLVIQAFQKNTNSPLTKRESEILQLIADGKSRTIIAKELFIDLETVKTHIKNIYLKLDVHSRADAIKIGRDNKFIM